MAAYIKKKDYIVVKDEVSNPYFINNPIFIKIKNKFDFLSLSRKKIIKKIMINERIVEIPFALKEIPNDRNARILDLGCVESILPLFLASLGYKVVGLDVRLYPYFHPNLMFTKGSMLELPFKNECYDAVTCISTLEHIGLGFYGDPLLKDIADFKATKEIFRVLKYGGSLILTVPFGKSGVSSQQRIYGLLRLKELLKNFKIEILKYYANFSTAYKRNNYWEEISQKEAIQIDSVNKASCTCLVKAKKL